MILTTTDEARQLDKKAMTEYGIPEAVLMENAGREAVRLFSEYVEWDGAETVVVCGTGNNGGDGFVAARYAAMKGAAVIVLVIGNQTHMSDASKLYMHAAKEMGIAVMTIQSAEEAKPFLDDADCIIDALIGIGLSEGKQVEGEKAALIRLMNESSAVILSLDVPSGLIADTGKAAGTVVNADFTVTMGSIKRGLMLYPGSEYAGTLLYTDIGIPDEAREEFSVLLAEKNDVRSLLPMRNRVAHKGTSGHVCIAAGSLGMEGAALLAARGALLSGAGKVSLLTPSKAAAAMAGRIPEVMVSSAGEGETFTKAMADCVLEKAQQVSVLAIGPGIGRDKETGTIVEEILNHASCPIVLDADGLYFAAENKIALKDIAAPMVLTPHVGEFARLTGLSAKDIEEHRIDYARAYARENNVVLVLKGAPTVTALPDGRAFVNTTGNPSMASGGMGDTLTGMIASLIAQGMDMGSAAFCGVYLHGLAGDLAAESGMIGITASDLASHVPAARKQVME